MKVTVLTSILCSIFMPLTASYIGDNANSRSFLTSFSGRKIPPSSLVSDDSSATNDGVQPDQELEKSQTQPEIFSNELKSIFSQLASASTESKPIVHGLSFIPRGKFSGSSLTTPFSSQIPPPRPRQLSSLQTPASFDDGEAKSLPNLNDARRRDGPPLMPRGRFSGSSLDTPFLSQRPSSQPRKLTSPQTPASFDDGETKSLPNFNDAQRPDGPQLIPRGRFSGSTLTTPFSSQRPSSQPRKLSPPQTPARFNSGVWAKRSSNNSSAEEPESTIDLSALFNEPNSLIASPSVEVDQPSDSSTNANPFQDVSKDEEKEPFKDESDDPKQRELTPQSQLLDKSPKKLDENKKNLSFFTSKNGQISDQDMLSFIQGLGSNDGQSLGANRSMPSSTSQPSSPSRPSRFNIPIKAKEDTNSLPNNGNMPLSMPQKNLSQDTASFQIPGSLQTSPSLSRPSRSTWPKISFKPRTQE